jgi:hypothetical protein
MAIKKFTCPPQTASGAGTFSDNLVGLQLVAGGGLTQGNFEFTEGVTEKINRKFSTGVFSDPINLENLGLESVEQARLILENNFKVYPNFDLTQVSNFTLFGSMVKRMENSVQNIISYFPGAIESSFIGLNYVTGATAFNIVYDETTNQTNLELDIARIRNPFEIDFTENATRNLSLRELPVSPLRNLTVEFLKYSLYLNGEGYGVKKVIPTQSLTNGTLKLSVEGNPFSGESLTYINLVIRPNDYEVNKVFNEDLDEVENFLLNRNVNPKYTATFQQPIEADDGTYYISNTKLTFPLYGIWNLDILTNNFTNYLTNLNEISESFDLYKTNLVSRFLTTGAFKDFDTIGQKMEKVLQIYGRSFDDTRKFINALAFMNSVNYNTGNDIPSKLLKNLAETLGWKTNISPITNDDFLSSVFGTKNEEKSVYSGVNIPSTPDELNTQFYKNLVLNAAFLFKSKGTRKSIETLMRLIGAPEALIEFNEFIYLTEQRINMSQFYTQYAQISGGTYVTNTPSLDLTDVYTIFGQQYTGFTTTSTFTDVNISREEYPVDEDGFPSTPENTEIYYFQIGSGWFEQTPQHRGPEEVDLTNSVFTGSNPNYQTSLVPYSYGQIYLERFRSFPYMTVGFGLRPVIDNNKSWVETEIGFRSNLDGNFNALYFADDDRYVINVKNIDLFMNPAQGLSYDVWFMSRETNYPIPNYGLSYVPPTYCDPNPYIEYPHRGGVDWTVINPQPKRKTFFEFAQSFWKNMINVRNRQFSTNGKSGGYPTLESIYWRYIESQNLTGIPNNNFNYTNMIEYVQGMGDYWIRLVEQMIPATTIWNTGVKFENSIFHRQKFVWRRQEGCQIVPVPCKPCITNDDLFPTGCNIQTIECDTYPWLNSDAGTLSNVLSSVLNSYLTNNGYSLFNCFLNGLTTEWYIQIKIDGVPIYQETFFNGVGYNIFNSVPTNNEWLNGLTNALDSLTIYGYDYYYTSDDTYVVYNSICTESSEGINFELNLGINFNIYCF